MKEMHILLLLSGIFIIHMTTFVVVFLNVFDQLSSTEGSAVTSENEPSTTIPPFLDPPVKRLVIFLLDAFRTSFVFSHSKCLPNIRSQHNLVFNVRTFTPTVTSPRIKTLTTGTVPEFADILFNMQSSEMTNSDSLIKRWNESNMSVAFYGDDTWVKLFSDRFFVRFKPVSSFYAVDFTEVDNAVTGPLMEELNRSDWNILILHYLGLDHIGHSRGPEFELVCKKLLEMDRLFLKIYQDLLERDKESMLLVLGDHGMSNEGSHGGSTDDEIYTPAIFVSSHFPFDPVPDKSSLLEISQVDIATSLALITGTTIPSSSLGIIPQPLLNLAFPYERHKTSILRTNYEHLLNLCKDCGPYSDVSGNGITLIKMYEELFRLQSILLGRHSTVNRLHLFGVVIFLTCSSLAFRVLSDNTLCLNNVNKESHFLSSIIIVLVINAFLLFTHQSNLSLGSFIFFSLTTIWPIFLPISLLLSMDFSFITRIYSTLPLLLTNAAVIFSSSYVEEEHFFWYVASQVVIVACAYQVLRPLVSTLQPLPSIRSLTPFVTLSLSIRFAKAYIYPGVKWSDENLDLKQTAQPVQTQLFLALNVAAAMFLIVKLAKDRKLGRFRSVLLVAAFVFNSLLIITYKSIRGDLKQWEADEDLSATTAGFDAFAATPYAQASFGVILLVTLYFSFGGLLSYQLYLPFFFQLGCLLLRIYLVVPLFLLVLISDSICSILTKFNYLDDSLTNLLIISVARTAFFVLENSNRLATIDVGAAYTGLSSHHNVLSVFLVVLAVSIGPFFIFLALRSSLVRRSNHRWRFIAYQTAIFTLCSMCVTLQANHLFVWSVFAPKLLYEFYWTLLFFFISILLF